MCHNIIFEIGLLPGSLVWAYPRLLYLQCITIIQLVQCHFKIGTFVIFPNFEIKNIWPDIVCSWSEKEQKIFGKIGKDLGKTNTKETMNCTKWGNLVWFFEGLYIKEPFLKGNRFSLPRFIEHLCFVNISIRLAYLLVLTLLWFT